MVPNGTSDVMDPLTMSDALNVSLVSEVVVLHQIAWCIHSITRHPAMRPLDRYSESRSILWLMGVNNLEPGFNRDMKIFFIQQGADHETRDE